MREVPEKDLLSNLLTADYRGAAYKKQCLDELIRRRVEGPALPEAYRVKMTLERPDGSSVSISSEDIQACDFEPTTIVHEVATKLLDSFYAALFAPKK